MPKFLKPWKKSLVMQKRILIPKERIAVIIGTRGHVKREIEKKTLTRLFIDDDILIEGESVNVMSAENIVTAIGRGFSPENAMMLLDEENTMSVIDLPRQEKILKRLRSRIIGTRGKTRRNLEEYTKTKISVFGKTVAIIGAYEQVQIATEAIEKLIKGFTHKTVYKFLEEKAKSAARPI